MQDIFRLDGKIALVTGASSGLGNRFAKTLAKAGAKVVVAARRRDKLDKLVQDITEEGGTVIAVTMDVTDMDSIQKGYDEAEKHLGLVLFWVSRIRRWRISGPGAGRYALPTGRMKCICVILPALRSGKPRIKPVPSRPI